MLEISTNSGEDQRFKEKKPNFICKLFRRKKSFGHSCVRIDNSTISRMDQGDNAGVGVARVPSSLSVRDVLVVPCGSPFPTTPARTRDIDTDMEALRISRQDNPFLKQVLASRESLADSLEESESDDINLMSQEFSGDFTTDPFSLPEVHQHMIRSPPPTSWPRSPNFKMFRFPNDSEQDSYQESPTRKSPSRLSSVSPRHDKANEFLHDRSFSLLTPAPLRSLTDVRRLHSRSSEESQQLMLSDPASKH
ncbi:uncharacterized protein LOC128985985 isoform X2 [Macrosteles quadrilineatus]|uniref:uncharacterized protein LOC128985985 isoform X2 n=1 Tax=Macrosteles quadrilineatus TaxID=74068 RepID=UPI0023E09639|nr:uncharacterized protein LOC128985985 isoform X2 [Macrosteles quadrilineatus]